MARQNPGKPSKTLSNQILQPNNQITKSLTPPNYGKERRFVENAFVERFGGAPGPTFALVPGSGGSGSSGSSGYSNQQQPAAAYNLTPLQQQQQQHQLQHQQQQQQQQQHHHQQHQQHQHNQDSNLSTGSSDREQMPSGTESIRMLGIRPLDLLFSY